MVKGEDKGRGFVAHFRKRENVWFFYHKLLWECNINFGTSKIISMEKIPLKMIFRNSLIKLHINYQLIPTFGFLFHWGRCQV